MRQQRKLQVFVSSTFTDLKDERQAAVEAILRARHIPAGMELFNAGDKSQWEVIKRWIDESDIYMLMVGGRYGSVETKSKKSYTQLEYEYALSIGKPHFALLMDEVALKQKARDFAIHHPDVEIMESENPTKIKAFRASLLNAKLISQWKITEEIKSHVRNSIDDLSYEHPDLTGWIRGDEAASAGIANELSRLSSENAQLVIENAELQRRVVLPEAPSEENLAQGEDIYQISAQYSVFEEYENTTTSKNICWS